jgi:hypothetical protein
MNALMGGVMPSDVTANDASISGRAGLSIIVEIVKVGSVSISTDFQRKLPLKEILT